MNRVAAGGTAVDIYGLGAILYELLTGRPPFRGESPFATVLQVMNEPPVPPSQVNNQVPEAMEAICLRCLEKDPGRRYPSSRELADDLERLAADMPSATARRQPGPRSRWRRAGPAYAIAAAILLAASLGVFWLANWPQPASTPSTRMAVEVTTPTSTVLPEGASYFDKGQIELRLPVSAREAREQPLVFDLRDAQYSQFGDWNLTRNAKIWTEDLHQIRYWGPIEDKEWFEVVYKFPFDFTVQAASLYASLNLVDGDARGFLEISTDRRQEWIELGHKPTLNPRGAPIDISASVRGARVIYVRARMKGRDDGQGSCMAQFLRTSFREDGMAYKKPYVFHLRAYDREVPILTAEATFSDGGSQSLWIENDGMFPIQRDFSKAGLYTITITVHAGALPPASKSYQIAVNTKGYDLTVTRHETVVRQGKRYQASGRLSDARGAPQGEVDYGDGGVPEQLLCAPDGTFHLDHLYRAPGKYFLRVTIHDSAGRWTTAIPTCVVSSEKATTPAGGPNDGTPENR
jgi:hypothetical protein